MAATVLPTHIPTNAEASSHLLTNISMDGTIQVKDATTNQTLTMRLAVLSLAAN
jgi:hypothetical protein